MTLQADVGLQWASKLYHALKFNWGRPRTGLEKPLQQSLKPKDDLEMNSPNHFKHLNLNMPIKGEDKLTCTRFRWECRPSQNLLLHWARGNLGSGPATRLNIFAVSSPSPPKAFILQCLVDDSAQPQKTLKPR